MHKNIFIDVPEKVEESQVFQDILSNLEEEGFGDDGETIYILQRPMLVAQEKEYYEYGVTLIVQNKKIIFIDCSPYESDSQFEYYCEDFIDDINALVTEKYPQYFKVLGRKREWSNFFVTGSKESHEILSKVESRKVKILTSVIIGSIQQFVDFDESTLENEEISVLEAVKNKIMLFDTNQTKFVYKEDVDKPIISLQGLAGSGKTELLLHKIRKIFVDETTARIGVTCFNRVLAESLTSRIIDFFNIMKVSEQITAKRLFIAHSWGSRNNPNSGLYSKICSEYGIEFQRYSNNRKNSEVWQDAIDYLKTQDFEPIFDYLFIDESQDFEPEYIKLCSMVSKKVYVAGDILQNIFSENSMFSYEDTDYVLNRVYRTDPRTILFSHIIGFGLIEKPVVRWLKDNEWEMAGYEVSQPDKAGMVTLKRENIKRFEGSDELSKVSSIKIFNEEITSDSIARAIDDIQEKNPDVKASDIAIVFTYYNQRHTRPIAKELGRKLLSDYSWDYVLVPEEKRIGHDNEVTITNINNVKGLEFPFVIVVGNQELNTISKTDLTEDIEREIRKRNALYMALTRSFISSYLIMSNNNVPSNYLDKLIEATEEISEKPIIRVKKPEPDDIIDEKLLYGLNSQLIKTQEDLILEILNEFNVTDSDKRDILEIISRKKEIKNGTMERKVVKSIIEQAIDFLN